MSQNFMLDAILSKLCELIEFLFTYKFNLEKLIKSEETRVFH